jgi:hypothetical protein
MEGGKMTNEQIAADLERHAEYVLGVLLKDNLRYAAERLRSDAAEIERLRAQIAEPLTSSEARKIILDLRNGCGDSSCKIRRPSGMVTNGGCRCHDTLMLALSAQIAARPSDEELAKRVIALYDRRGWAYSGIARIDIVADELRAAREGR